MAIKIAEKAIITKNNCVLPATLVILTVLYKMSSRNLFNLSVSFSKVLKIVTVFHPKNLSVIKSLYSALKEIFFSLTFFVKIANLPPVKNKRDNKKNNPIIVGINEVNNNIKEYVIIVRILV